MKITYKYVTGETLEIEVDETFGQVMEAMRVAAYNNRRAETGRHDSIQDMEEQGYQFADKNCDVEREAVQNITNAQLYAALSQLLPQQRELLNKVYGEGKSLAAVARDDGVKRQSVFVRMMKIQGKLRKLLG